MGLAKFVLRTSVGGIIMSHGLQKLNGSFGGSGIEGTEKMMEHIGMHPPKYHAWAVALSETLGGGLTAAGFLSPLGPSMIIGSQAVAINKVHQKNGFWAHKSGYEYNVVLMAAAFALAEMGPGAFSVDRLFGKRRSGSGWALASAALGLGAAVATLQLAQKFAPEESETGKDAADDTVSTSNRGASASDRSDSASDGSGGGTSSTHQHSGPSSTSGSQSHSHS